MGISLGFDPTEENYDTVENKKSKYWELCICDTKGRTNCIAVNCKLAFKGKKYGKEHFLVISEITICHGAKTQQLVELILTTLCTGD